MAEDLLQPADNRIVYNVVLDPGDIARQAEEIRNQLDLALTSAPIGTSFNNYSQIIQPNFATSVQPDFTNINSQFAAGIDRSFWEKAQEQAGRVYDDVTTGLGKIRQDISMALDKFGSVFQPNLVPSPTSPYNNLLPDSFGEYLIGSIGLVGNLAGPVTPSMYSSYSKQKLGEGIEDFIQNPSSWYDDLTSTTPGMIANIAAYFTPLAPYVAVADVAAIGDKWLSGAYNKREDLAGGIKEIAAQQFGNISTESARGIASNMIEYVNSYTGYSRGYDIDEVSQNIVQFGNSGGFSNVYDVNQLNDKVMSVVEDTRQIARNLGIFQEEAISIMAELEQKSMVNVENFRSFSDKIRTYAGVLRQDPTEVLGNAMNVAEQFRVSGSMLTPQGAMQTFLDANVEAQRLVQSTDPYLQGTVYRMGGLQGVTQSLLGIYSAFPNTPLGSLGYITNNVNNYNSPLDFSNAPETAEDWLRITNGKIGEDRLKNITVPEVSLYMTNLAREVWDSISNETPTLSDLEATMPMLGLSKDQSRIVIESIRNQLNALNSGGSSPGAKLDAASLYTGLKSLSENAETDVISTFLGGISKPFNTIGREISYLWGEGKDWLSDIFVGNRRMNDDGTIDGSGILIGSNELEFDVDNPYILKDLSAGWDGSVGSRVLKEYEADLKNKGYDNTTIQNRLKSLKSGNNVPFILGNTVDKIKEENENIISNEKKFLNSSIYNAFAVTGEAGILRQAGRLKNNFEKYLEETVGILDPQERLKQISQKLTEDIEDMPGASIRLKDQMLSNMTNLFSSDKFSESISRFTTADAFNTIAPGFVTMTNQINSYIDKSLKGYSTEDKSVLAENMRLILPNILASGGKLDENLMNNIPLSEVHNLIKEITSKTPDREAFESALREIGTKLTPEQRDVFAKKTQEISLDLFADEDNKHMGGNIKLIQQDINALRNKLIGPAVLGSDKTTAEN